MTHKTRKFFAFASAATLVALSACDQRDHTIVAGGPADDNGEPANTVNVVLPPAIAVSKTYRCEDNSLVYIDWLTDGLNANFRAARTDAPLRLTAAADGEALTAAGYSLTGAATAATITLTRPDKGSQSCRA